MNKIIDIEQDHAGQFAEVVSMIRQTKASVISMANTALIDLHWKVGKYISDKMAVSEWGDGVVKLSARELNKQLNAALYERTKIDKPKLSTVLRQIAPQAEQM